MAHPGVAGSGHRRSMLVGSASLALHSGLLLLAVALTGQLVHSPPKKLALTSIEVVHAVPLPPSPPSPASTLPQRPIAQPTSPSVNTEARARRPQVQRPTTSAPAAKLSLADLKVGYDAPTNFANRAPTTVDGVGDAGRSGIATDIHRQLGDGVAAVQIPQPSAVSLARSPRPKADYSNLRLPGASTFAGRTIKLLLLIDTSGRVRDVQILQGVDRDLDRRTLALVHNFEYEPALNEVGAAVPGTSRWDIQIVEDEDDQPFQNVFGRRHR